MEAGESGDGCEYRLWVMFCCNEWREGRRVGLERDVEKLGMGVGHRREGVGDPILRNTTTQ